MTYFNLIVRLLEVFVVKLCIKVGAYRTVILLLCLYSYFTGQVHPGETLSQPSYSAAVAPEDASAFRYNYSFLVHVSAIAQFQPSYSFFLFLVCRVSFSAVIHNLFFLWADTYL